MCSLAILTACQSGDAGDTTKATPSTTNSTTSESPSMTEPSTTVISTVTSATSSPMPPTTLSETPDSPPTTLSEPILCDRYHHPLHHLTCEEADAKHAAKQQRHLQTASVDATIPSPQDSYQGDSDLKRCIAHYESTSGAGSSNQYQFQDGTWQAYGGTGSPESASMAEQNAVFDRAWADGGEHHWAAQKGRCF